MAGGWGSRSRDERQAEPEIIPPDRPDPRRRDDGPIWTAFGTSERGRIYFAKPSLFSLVVAALVLAIALAAALTLFVGAFLILLPAVAAVIGALALTSLARAACRRFGWCRAP